MALQPLPLDEIDVIVVSKPVDPGCPFCGAGAIVMQTSINPTPPFGDGPVFQSRISCLCGLRLIANGATRKEAQMACLSRWSTRVTRWS